MADVNTHTPSGDKVEIVSANEWKDMNITELFDQKMILNNRLSAAMQFGNPAMLQQLNRGMAQIDAMISYKEQQKTKNINNKNRDLTGLI